MKKSNQEKKFPKNIKNLRFSKYLLKESANSKFHFALYKDKNGVNYYCKMWVGDKKDENYNWIINEIKAYKLLNSLKNKNLNKTNNKYSDIIIPKIFDENTSDKCVWFVIKEAKGKPLKFQNTEIVLNSYLKIHSLLSYFYARID